MTPDRIAQFLEQIDKLPDSAAVPVAVAAKHDGVCDRTVRRTYPLVKLSPNRYGVTLRYLRHRGESAA